VSACWFVCEGSECSVQISNAVPAATPDFRSHLVSDNGSSLMHVTRGVQTLPRSTHPNRMSSTYQSGTGGSLSRPASTPRTVVADKQVLQCNDAFLPRFVFE